MNQPAPCARLEVRAVPNAGRNALVGWVGSALKVRVQAPPEDGRANRALTEYLAETLDLPRHAVEVERGASSRQKLVLVRGLTAEEIRQRLARKMEGADGGPGSC